MEVLVSGKYILAAIIYSVLGILILAVSFVIFDKCTPGELWKEVVIKQNMALAIVAAAMMLAMAHIISSAIHG
jgi:putative membrane protein